MNQLFQYAGNQGISIFVAAGDNDASDGLQNNQYNVDYPGSSPYVTSCGGTKLISQNNQRISEVVWNDNNGVGTGGGVSRIFPVPSYQTGIALRNLNTGIVGRTLPDLAGNADPQTGYIINVDGELQIIGGTSAVAPLMAALTARINQLNKKRCGFLNPKIYGHSECFFDVISGNNRGYTSTYGFDACSGLGCPKGELLANLFE
jgi:kumamolisin